jgi:phosphoglycolate phosphatase
MSMPDWSRIDLVVFDVDGTLYDQQRLRRAMLGRLLLDAARTRSLHALRVLRVFRRVRESLGDAQDPDFEVLQYERAAQKVGCTAEQVRALATEWMERRPLPLLAGCRLPHVDRLFEGLRDAAKAVAVFSDYPAQHKLTALGLQAHPVVCAGDADGTRLKPDPAGLLTILQRTGVPAARALMIGDRFDRDAAAAQRAGVQVLVRSRVRHPSVPTFRRYDDPVFHPVLAPVRGQLAGSLP